MKKNNSIKNTTNKTTNKTNKKSTKKETKKATKPKDKREFEARFLEIDKNVLLQKIKALGGVQKQANTIYRRAVFGLCDIKRGYVRVRDEGDKTTMTAKIYKDVNFPDEYELEIANDFETGQSFLKSLNLNEKAYHETMREKWRIPFGKKHELCEIAIDCIPGLPMYAELECKTEADLKKSIKLLAMDKKMMRFGAYGKIYDEYYGISQTIMDNDVASITFGGIKDELKPFIKKGEEFLDTIYKSHLEIYRGLKK